MDLGIKPVFKDDIQISDDMRSVFRDFMVNTGPYEWQMKCGVMLATGKQLLIIPAGFGKSRVLIAAAVHLSLKGIDVVVNMTNQSILERDSTEFEKVIRYNESGMYGDTGDITLRYIIEEVNDSKSIHV